MVFDLSNIRSRRSAAAAPRQQPPAPRRPAPVKSPAEQSPDVAEDRRPLPVSTAGARRPGPTLIRGWSTLHLAGFAVLLAVCMACAVVVYRELADEATMAGNGEPPVAPAIAAAAAEDGSFVMPPLATYNEVTARPLFSVTRRPAAAARQTSAAMSSLTLAGVVISRDGRVALIRQGKSPGLTRVREGQHVGGWTVQSIAADRVVVSDGAAQAELKLLEDAPPDRAE
jgi:hypothetical protein